MLKLRIGALRRLREQKCWSQEDLAQRAGISVRTLQRMESGSSPRMANVAFVAEALQVPLAGLVDDTPAKGSAASDDHQTLHAGPALSGIPVVLRRMAKGSDLLDSASGASAMLPQIGDVSDPDEADDIGYIVDFLRDFIDIESEVSMSERLRYGLDLTERLKALQRRGWWVLAGQKRHAVRSASCKSSIEWVTFVVMAARPDDATIQHRDNGEPVALMCLPEKFKFA